MGAGPLQGPEALETRGDGEGEDETAAAAAAAAERPQHEALAIQSDSILSTKKSLDSEIYGIALPTLATLAADPVAALVSTAWVGQIGATELAAVGVALSVFGSFTKLFNMPLLAIITSSTATALGRGSDESSQELGSSVAASLVLGAAVGILQSIILATAGFASLPTWGAGPASPLADNAAAYLGVRTLGAPATVLFLALQGAFRGLGDTRTPFYATLGSNLINILLEPLFIFGLGWGVRGAAGAITMAQVLSSVWLFSALRKRLTSLPRTMSWNDVKEAIKFLGPTGQLTVRTLAITAVFAVGTGLAARTDSAHAAAYQIAFQIWLASSLLADSLAVAAQSLIARSLASGDEGGRSVANATISRVITFAVILGILLAIGLGASVFILQIQRLFTKDESVLTVLSLLLPAVIFTQPLNALAFTMDGILYGCNGFSYAAQAMVISAIPAIGVMTLGNKFLTGAGPSVQLAVVWGGLATVMALRVLTIYLPLKFKKPPFDVLVRQATNDSVT